MKKYVSAVVKNEIGGCGTNQREKRGLEDFAAQALEG